MDFKVGDKVSVIHESIIGVIERVENQLVTLIDSEGFKRSYRNTELTKRSEEEAYKLKRLSLEKDNLSKIKGVIKPPKSNLRKNEIDLHIEELVDYHGDMTNHEILMKQMSTCKQFIQRAIDSNQKRVVLIHGKGQGVLKTEIHTYLNKLSVYHELKIEYADAAYTEYGMGGATEVFIG